MCYRLCVDSSFINEPNLKHMPANLCHWQQLNAFCFRFLGSIVCCGEVGGGDHQVTCQESPSPGHPPTPVLHSWPRRPQWSSHPLHLLLSALSPVRRDSGGVSPVISLKEQQQWEELAQERVSCQEEPGDPWSWVRVGWFTGSLMKKCSWPIILEQTTLVLVTREGKCKYFLSVLEKNEDIVPNKTLQAIVLKKIFNVWEVTKNISELEYVCRFKKFVISVASEEWVWWR